MANIKSDTINDVKSGAGKFRGGCSFVAASVRIEGYPRPTLRTRLGGSERTERSEAYGAVRPLCGEERHSAPECAGFLRTFLIPCAVPAGSRHRAGDLCFTAWGTARNVTGRRRSMERLRKLCGRWGRRYLLPAPCGAGRQIDKRNSKIGRNKGEHPYDFAGPV